MLNRLEFNILRNILEIDLNKNVNKSFLKVKLLLSQMIVQPLKFHELLVGSLFH
jgi:hypothetical protein